MSLLPQKINEQLDYLIEELEKKYHSQLSDSTINISANLRSEVSAFAYSIYSNNKKTFQNTPKFDFLDIKKVQESLGIEPENIAWDKGWIFKNKTASYSKLFGQYLVYKAGESKLIEPGSFVFSERINEDSAETMIDIRIRSFEMIQIDNSKWYYLRGNYYLSYHNIIRFYFSLNFEKYETVLGFIKSLKEYFNERLIPFELKFEIAFSERYDNLILYVQQQHYYIAFLLINELHFLYKSEGIFKDQNPLFTKKLLLGVSFAEDPNLLGQSYGSNRCSLITDIYLKYYQKNIQKETINVYLKRQIQNEFITRGLRQKFDFDDFYRNPNSKFPYDFSIFNSTPQYSTIRPISCSENLLTAHHIGKILCKLALIIHENNQTKCYWVSSKKDEFDSESITCRFVNNSFKQGKLGIAYFLARLLYFFRYDNVIRHICELLINELSNTPEKEWLEEVKNILQASNHDANEKIEITQQIEELTLLYNELGKYESPKMETFIRFPIIQRESNATLKEQVGDSKFSYKTIKSTGITIIDFKKADSTKSFKPYFSADNYTTLVSYKNELDKILNEITSKGIYTEKGSENFNPTIAEKGLSMLGIALIEINDMES